MITEIIDKYQRIANVAIIVQAFIRMTLYFRNKTFQSKREDCFRITK
jgi:hypothetical protein